MINKSKKVAVALSGGVDSSVALALLKNQGFDVVGFYMRLWKDNANKKQQTETEKRVREIGKVLGVKIFIFDFQKEFKKIVTDYFLAELKKGNTPNPCVVCNSKVKFGLLMKKTKEMGCDYLATGHYAKKIKTKNEKLKIIKAGCIEKDQSYFLWQLKQSQLRRVIFPLGEIESKQMVKEMANKFGLPTYETPESNDVCFLAQTNLQQFLTKKMGEQRAQRVGKVVDLKGNILGEHKGLWFYTIGQRKGIEIPIKKGRTGLPWFVVKKDIKKNVLIVSQNEKDLFGRELIVKKVNWVSITEPKLPLKCMAKIRYGAKETTAIIKEKISLNKYRVVFTKPQRAITPGQSVVWYLGKELLGGGIIE